MSYRYFCYGSALDPALFAEWCRQEGHPQVPLENGVVAVLDDVELDLVVPSHHWKGAVGTLVPRDGGQVFGMLFDVANEHADIIRQKEGVPSGLYREQEVEVRLWIDGDEETTIQLLPARAFVAEADLQGSPPLPSQGWVETVIRGAESRGLPETWIAEIRRKAGR